MLFSDKALNFVSMQLYWGHADSSSASVLSTMTSFAYFSFFISSFFFIGAVLLVYDCSGLFVRTRKSNIVYI